ncbi:MAG TPA: alpha/beta hydrolase [Thermohalobaculum sp.]|nr:alpha/beta hydrolase [Thermohalobaculum sp.]
MAEPEGLPAAQTATLVADDGLPITLWVVHPAPDRPVVLYFMGNGGSLPSHASILAELAGQGMGIVALNYRGAGGAPGKPSQSALTADALALYDRLDTLIGEPVPAIRRVLFGTSLGAALAIQLAAARPAAGLILEAPFNRLCEVAQIHFPIFPACLLLPYERWASADLIGQITAPVLILHGDADATIPLSQGQALFNVANQPKRLIAYRGGNHNDLRLHGAGIDAINFIESLAWN